jgi:hypothetical protein
MHYATSVTCVYGVVAASKPHNMTKYIQPITRHASKPIETVEYDSNLVYWLVDLPRSHREDQWRGQPQYQPLCLPLSVSLQRCVGTIHMEILCPLTNRVSDEQCDRSDTALTLTPLGLKFIQIINNLFKYSASYLTGRGTR